MCRRLVTILGVSLALHHHVVLHIAFLTSLLTRLTVHVGVCVFAGMQARSTSCVLSAAGPGAASGLNSLISSSR